MDNWKVKLEPDNMAENTWTATATRGEFSFSQKVQGNEGEITEFCKTARTMHTNHVKNQQRARELEHHFDEILESEDKREVAEAAAALAKAEAEKVAAEQAAKEAEVAAAQAAADAASKPADVPPAPEPEPVVEAPIEVPAAEPIQDAPTPEEPKNETPV